jgi:hypothetical protein
MRGNEPGSRGDVEMGKEPRLLYISGDLVLVAYVASVLSFVYLVLFSDPLRSSKCVLQVSEVPDADCNASLPPAVHTEPLGGVPTFL